MNLTTCKTQKVVYRSEAEWLEKKQYLLTAKEAVAVLGCSSEMSALDVWMEKTGLEPAKSPVAEMSRKEWITNYAVKRIIHSLYSNLLEVTIDDREPGFWVRPEYSWWASLSTFTTHNMPILAFYDPHASPDSYRDASAEYSIPLAQYIEFQYTLAAMGAERGVVAALVDGPEFVHDELERNDSFIDGMTPRLEQFWASVLSKTPPESDGSDACTEAIARLYNEPDASKCALDPKLVRIHENLLVVKQLIGEHQRDEKTLKNQLKMAIGNHSVGILPGGSFYSYNNVDVAGYTVDARTTRRLVFHPVKGTK